jgi:TonB family protein
METPAGQTVRTRFDILFSQDGRARWEENAGDAPRLRVWDGSTLWDYYSSTNNFTQRPFKTAPDSEPQQLLKLGRDLANVRAATVEREEPLEFGGKPVPCYVVRAEYVNFPVGGSLRSVVRTVWISRDRDLVLRDSTATDVTFDGAPAKARLTFQYSAIEWDIPIPDEAFSFHPPQGSSSGTLDGTTAPIIKERVSPEYSEEARRARHQGTVLLDVEVDTNGQPANIRVIRSLGMGLDEKAIEAVKKWKFVPATKGGVPVKVSAQIEVEFRLQADGEPRPGVNKIGNGVTAPVLIYKTEPEYSEEGRAAKFQGVVLLYAQINPLGQAVNLRVLRSLGLGLDEKAMEAVKMWKFKPGMKDGNPVTVEVQIEVAFRLQ